MSVHCCEMMRNNVENECALHPVRAECPDCLITFDNRSGRYGLMIHDGGTSSITIAYCPWCGTSLPEAAEDDLLQEAI